MIGALRELRSNGAMRISPQPTALHLYQGTPRSPLMTNNLEYYKTFYYGGKLSSITLAAKELSISQPAVTQSIHQLEKSLGCTLFQRTSRGMKLTSEGNLLYRYIERGYEQIELGEQRLSQLLHLDAGEVRIGASDMTLRFFLLPYLEKFHEL